MARGERLARLFDGFLPGQEPIESYGLGGFRFGGLSHRGSLLALPSGMKAWAAVHPGDITADSLAPLFAEADMVDVLLIGCGTAPAPLAASLRSVLREAAMSADAMPTGLAASTYNVLLEEGRRVAAALLAVA